MIRGRVCAAGALFAVLAASGCGVLGDGNGDAGSLGSMFERVPDNAANRAYLFYGNLARLRGDSGPAKDLDGELKTLTQSKSKGALVVVEPLLTGMFMDEFETEAGFDLMNIDASLAAGEAPNQLSLFQGRFDTAAIGTALTKNTPFAKDIKTGTRAGMKTYSVGEDGEGNIDWLSAFNPSSDSLRVGGTDSLVVYTSKDQVFDAALDVSEGNGSSLADNDRYVDIANAVDEAKAFNAFLVGDPSSYVVDADGLLGDEATPEQVARVQEQVEAGKLGLAPWQVAVVADAPGELIVVLAHADEPAAKRNETRLRTVVEQGVSSGDAQPWSKRLSIDSIAVDGSLLVAHLKSKAPIAYKLTPDRFRSSKDNLLVIAEQYAA